jgi:hypothetical protein
MELLATGAQIISPNYYNFTRYGMTSIVDPLLRLENRNAIAIPSLSPSETAIAFTPTKPNPLPRLDFNFKENPPDLIYLQIGNSTIALNPSDYYAALTNLDPLSHPDPSEFSRFDPSHLF